MSRNPSVPFRVRAALLAAALIVGVCAHAQSVDLSAKDRVPEASAAELIRGDAGRSVGARSGARPGTRPEVRPETPPGTGADGIRTLEPFGANLFTGGFSNDAENGLNPTYVLQPGDRVSVRIWGATEFNQSLVLDAQGNVFLPSVGPVRLAGTLNRDLNARVSAAVARVYTDNVRVYASLDGAQPVAVFVTGFVAQPGRFAGIPSNSALHFIDRAGGIEAARGSYRDVRVLRAGREIASIDLYDFLRDGDIERVQFQDGDTIVVGRRGATVALTGAIAAESLYELEGGSIDGGELAERAMTEPGVSHVGVSGVRGAGSISRYVPIAEFRAMTLRDGDAVHFRTDRQDPVIVVDVEGAHLGPSRFAVPRDTRLSVLLDHVAVDPALAATGAVSIKRKEIAARQKGAIEESLARLEARYLTASSATDAESAIRAREAELISRFVANARRVEPTGRLVVARDGDVRDVLLESGDTIVVPRVSESVLLSGEVLISQAILHERGLSARDYVELAGGFSEQADTSRVVVVSQNGEVRSGKDPAVRAGDEIIVLPDVPSKNLQIAATLVDIVYKIAVAAAVAINL